jgi:hypothetical protein
VQFRQSLRQRSHRLLVVDGRRVFDAGRRACRVLGVLMMGLMEFDTLDLHVYGLLVVRFSPVSCGRCLRPLLCFTTRSGYYSPASGTLSLTTTARELGGAAAAGNDRRKLSRANGRRPIISRCRSGTIRFDMKGWHERQKPLRLFHARLLRAFFWG